MTYKAEGALSLEVLRVQHTCAIARLDALECQSRDQRSTNTATILSGEDLHGVLLVGIFLLGPVQNLTQCLGTASLEMGILVEDGAISTNVTRLVVLLLADSCNTAGRQTGGAGANELGYAADQFQLMTSSGDVEAGVEEIMGLLKVLEGIPI